MAVAVIVPWRPGDPHREATWERLRAQHESLGRTVIEGRHDDGLWCKAEAVADALTRTDADILVIHDADVWSDGLDDAIGAIGGDIRWAIPHLLVYRLAQGQVEVSTTLLDETAYEGLPGGGIVVIDRAAYLSWAFALTALHGPPWRGEAHLWHWWHPAQRRASRGYGRPESADLKRRYVKARYDRAAMADLIAEAHAWTSPSTTPASPMS